MQYVNYYKSPLGDLLLSNDEQGLTGIWFSGGKYFAKVLSSPYVEQENKILAETKKWLDIYFAGKEPDFTPPLHLTGSDFRKRVGQIMCGIPYGRTISYWDIAKIIAREKGIPKMSAQAVGGAVGHNPISIIIPCHRVVGKNGSLTGYGGGIDRKIKLLTLEKADISRFFIPAKGTAL